MSAQYPLLLLLDHQKGYRFSLVVVDRKFTLGVLLGPKKIAKLLFRTSAFCTILGYPRLCNLLPATPKQTPPNTLLRKKEEIVRNFPSLVKNYDELSESTKCAMRCLYTTTTSTLFSHTLRFLTAKLDTKRIQILSSSRLFRTAGPSKKNHFSACSSRPAAAFFHGFALPIQKIMIFLRMGRFFHQTIFRKICLSFRIPEPLFRAIPVATLSNHSPEGRAVETKGKIYEKMRFFGPATTEN